MQQRMLLRDWGAAINWLRTLNPSTTLDVNGSYRSAGAQLYPSAGDTPVTASQARRTTSVNVNTRVSHLRGRQNIRAGMDILTFPVRENFSFGITSPLFNDPASPDYIPTLAPYDLTRGGTPFVFSQKRTGALYSAFFQDTIKAGNFNISLGLRYDVYRFLVQGNQVQPRIGVSYQIKQTNTVLRASYNRTYQPPPYENLLLSNSQESAALAPPEVRQTLGTAVVSIRPERQNFYEVGLQQGLGRRMSVTASYYHKQGRDQQDNNNFFNTGVIFPITLASIRVNGVEGRWSFAPMGGFSGSVSVTHARAISTPPFTGGLYLGNDAIVALTAGPFVIDHDQPLALQAVLNYTSKRGWFSTFSNRYDSGLVSNPSDPAEVAADPDYRDLLPYVNLNGDPPRVRPRNIIDLVVGYERRRNEKSLWELSMQVTNLTGETALYNFQSAFVGTRVVQPRTFGGRLRWYF
jgi:hypothetical protein